MSCSVAIAATSPAANFSSSHHRLSLTCKTSPETLCLLDGSPSSTSPAKSSRFNRGPSAFFKLSPPPSNCSAANNSGPSTSSSSALKRKRPVTIDVPMMTDSLSFVPIGSDGRKVVEVDGVTCSVYCKRGKKRIAIEDRFTVDLDIGGDPKLAFFGIFDGHSGSKAAEFAAQNLGKRIMDEVMRDDGNVEDAVANGYHKTDSDFLEEETTSGTCCVTAFVRRADLVVSNAGDCRAVLSISGNAEPLTSDHRPSREDERERIENLGGYVHFCQGLWRLQGSLAVSRGIGDSHMKQWVIPDPETRVLAIEPEFEFLILASDGLWDKVSNQEAVDLARPLCLDLENPSPLSACKKLTDLSVNRGSVDDISRLMQILQLKHFHLIFFDWVEVSMTESRSVNIHMFCARKPISLLLSMLTALDALGLDIQQAVISCFNGFALDVFEAAEDIIQQMVVLNPQSCRRLLETMVLDNHISMKMMYQTVSAGPPSMLRITSLIPASLNQKQSSTSIILPIP